MVVIKPVIENTKFTIRGNKVVKVVYPRNEKKLYTKNQIGTLVQKFQENVKTRKGKQVKMMVSIDIPKLGFRSGKSFTKTEDIEFPDSYDWERVPQWVIYFYQEDK
jgi:hypothetical protein